MPIDLVLLGPPGSGKTRACINACREWFKKHKAGASEVAYLAFTTAAADEAAGRILDEDLARDVGDRLPFFKTIHSVAFRGMKTERRDIRPVLAQDMKYFSTLSGYEGTFAVNNTAESLAEAYQLSEVQPNTIWDKCLVAYNLTRASASTRAQIEVSQKTFSPSARRLVGYLEEEAYQGFVKNYEQFKLANGLVDFTDMLVYAMTQMTPFDKVRYVVVDEAQDLSPILNAVVESLFRHAELRLWAGDDDQCIFSFAAADPQMFIDRARRSRRFFLRETNRFGKEIVDFSMPIIRRVRDRVPKELVGMSTKEHNIRTTGDFTPAHATKTMLLHRHKAGCQALASMYYREGLPFRNEKGKDPLGPSHSHILEGFRAFIDLADGKDVHMAAVNDMVQKLMPTQLVAANGEKKKILVHGARKKMEDAKGRTNLMDLMRSKILTMEGANLIATKSYQHLHRADDLLYYKKVLERGLPLDGEKCTIITTMHASKGREADRVVIFNERGRRCVEDVDSEHRLAYVAATRTMGDLEICMERNVDWAEYPYDFPTKEKGGNWR